MYVRVRYNPVEVEMSLPGGSCFSFSPRQGRNASGTLFSFTLLEWGESSFYLLVDSTVK